MYQLTETTSVIRLDDNAWIPADPANRDYVDYLAWVADGNEPLPTAPDPAPLPYDPTTELANPTVAEWNEVCEAAGVQELKR